MVKDVYKRRVFVICRGRVRDEFLNEVSAGTDHYGRTGRSFGTGPRVQSSQIQCSRPSQSASASSMLLYLRGVLAI